MDEKEVEKAHSNFDFFFNKVAWTAIMAVVSFAAFQLNKLSDNVAELNKNMALMVYQSDQFKRDIQNVIERVNRLEGIKK